MFKAHTMQPEEMELKAEGPVDPGPPADSSGDVLADSAPTIENIPIPSAAVTKRPRATKK
jgi:hypothetical protein